MSNTIPPEGSLCAFRKQETHDYAQPPCNRPSDDECHNFDGCMYRAEIESGQAPSVFPYINFWCHQHHKFEAQA